MDLDWHIMGNMFNLFNFTGLNQKNLSMWLFNILDSNSFEVPQGAILKFSNDQLMNIRRAMWYEICNELDSISKHDLLHILQYRNSPFTYLDEGVEVPVFISRMSGVISETSKMRLLCNSGRLRDMLKEFESNQAAETTSLIDRVVKSFVEGLSNRQRPEILVLINEYIDCKNIESTKNLLKLGEDNPANITANLDAKTMEGLLTKLKQVNLEFSSHNNEKTVKKSQTPGSITRIRRPLAVKSNNMPWGKESKCQSPNKAMPLNLDNVKHEFWIKNFEIRNRLREALDNYKSPILENFGLSDMEYEILRYLFIYELCTCDYQPKTTESSEKGFQDPEEHTQENKGYFKNKEKRQHFEKVSCGQYFPEKLDKIFKNLKSPSKLDKLIREAAINAKKISTQKEKINNILNSKIVSTVNKHYDLGNTLLNAFDALHTSDYNTLYNLLYKYVLKGFYGCFNFKRYHDYKMSYAIVLFSRLLLYIAESYWIRTKSKIQRPNTKSGYNGQLTGLKKALREIIDLMAIYLNFIVLKYFISTWLYFNSNLENNVAPAKKSLIKVSLSELANLKSSPDPYKNDFEICLISIFCNWKLGLSLMLIQLIFRFLTPVIFIKGTLAMVNNDSVMTQNSKKDLQLDCTKYIDDCYCHILICINLLYYYLYMPVLSRGFVVFLISRGCRILGRYGHKN